MSNRRGTYYYKVFPEIISIPFFLSNSATPLYCHYKYNVIARGAQKIPSLCLGQAGPE